MSSYTLFAKNIFFKFLQSHSLVQIFNYLILHHYPHPQQNTESSKWMPSNTLEWIFKPTVSGKERKMEEDGSLRTGEPN